ncbi:hypothetical protein DXV75_10060 [Alteromonas aestuariivivens]|uniref:Uncharacterized protein n=1 Tax=Alteromonas aestuariivivens TaxID=1938339 RepID=A0A3D8M7I1_9ALTE|nr:hypothetical protein [Alteromonas aestuariivivens]RDV25620.1 hypothetical protein DXV75_10060 [Alteromonas aestuariivivens]
MKTWTLLPLVVFIAIAGYQYGYYHAKLELSEADKKRISIVVDDSSLSGMTSQRKEFGVQAAELPAQLSALEVDGRVEASASSASPTEAGIVSERALQIAGERSAEPVSDSENSDGTETGTNDNEQDLAAATQLLDFLQLHPEAEHWNLHSVKCEAGECQLIGEFQGPPETFMSVLREMQLQSWWRYAGASSNTTASGATTHFVLSLTQSRVHS